MKEAVSWKEDAHKVICQNSTVENKRRYKAKKAVSKVLSEKSEDALTE